MNVDQENIISMVSELDMIWQNTADAISGQYATFSIPIPAINLFELLQRQGGRTVCYFKDKSDKREILGVNALISFHGNRSIRIIENLIHANRNLVAMGALPFYEDTLLMNEWNNFSHKEMFIPQFVFIRNGSTHELRVNVLKEQISDDRYRKSICRLLGSLFATNSRDNQKPVVVSSDNFPGEKEWKQSLVEVINGLSSEHHNKVVMSRKRQLNLRSDIDPLSIYGRMKRQNGSYQFYYQTNNDCAFFSATPETLFKLEGNVLRVDAIAGTRTVSGEGSEDSSMAIELLASHKDANEHRIVCDFVVDSLRTLASDVNTVFDRNVLLLPKLMHLHSVYEGRLKHDVTISKIIQVLHPTPAVGGYPKQKSLDILRKLERYDRGLYAGPVGYINGDCAEFAVAIRSGLIERHAISLYAGAGIVYDSIPDSEWYETERKLDSIKDLLY